MANMIDSLGSRRGGIGEGIDVGRTELVASPQECRTVVHTARGRVGVAYA